MNRMVWNTILIWLIGIGILAGITFLALLGFRDMLALIIMPMVLSVFVLPVTSAVCGFRAANGQADVVTALLIETVIGLFLLYGLTDGFQLHSSSVFLCLVPVLATGTSFGLGRLLQVAKPVSTVLYRGTLAATIFIIILSLYLLGAVQSQMAYLSLPEELFYHRPNNSITAFHGQDDTIGNHLLCSDETNEPFNGKIISYEKRLTLDFFTEKASGVGYYIDGFLFGNSGDVVLPGYFNSWYGTNEYFNEWLYNEQAAGSQIYLLHKDYQKTLEEEFPGGAAVYYEEEPDLRQNYNTSPLPRGVAIYSENNKLIRKEITYHQNGVADWIDVSSNNGSGWKRDYNISFDSLGYRHCTDETMKWRENDFVLTDFNSFEAVGQTFDGSNTISHNPERMVYAPYPEKWEDGGNLVDNIISVYGFPLTTVSVYIGGKYQDFTQFNLYEGDDFLSLIGRSTLTLSFLETDDGADAFQYDAVRFLITSEDGDKSIHLYYMDGKILIEDGPYYLDVLAEPEMDSENDIAIRKTLYQSFMNTIETYIHEHRSEEEEIM